MHGPTAIFLAAAALAAAPAQAEKIDAQSPATRPAAAPADDALPADPDARWAALIAAAEQDYYRDDSDAMGRAAAEALALAEARYPQGDARIARSLIQMGSWHIIGTSHNEGEAVLRRALAILDAAGQRDTIDGAMALSYLGEIRMQQGAYAEAEAMFAEGLAIARRRAGDGHAETARLVYIYAMLLQWMKRPGEAEPMVERALAAGRAQLGRDHHHMLLLEEALAGLMLITDREEQSLAIYQDIVARAGRALGPEHRTTLGLTANMATILVDMGRYGEAEPVMRRAMEARSRRLGADNGEVLGNRIALADLLAARGDYAEAEEIGTDVLAAVERRYGSNHPLSVAALELLARMTLVRGDAAEALALQQRALAVRRAVEGPDATTTLTSEMNLADMLLANGSYAEAEPFYRRYVAAMAAKLGPDSAAALAGEARLVELLHASADHPRSMAAAAALLPRMAAVNSADHPLTIRVQFMLGWAQWGAGNKEEAHATLSDALTRAIAALGRSHPTTAQMAASLAHLRLELPERRAQAIEPAVIVADALRSRQRRDAGSSDTRRQTIAALHRASDSANLTLVADALWAARTRENGERTVLRAFEALQIATAGGTDQAVLRTAARQTAAARGPELAELVERREAGEAAWQRANTALTAALVGAGEDADALRVQRRAELQTVERDLQRVDADLRTRFPDYFSLIRPEAISQQATQSMLGPDEAVLMIVPTDYGTHVMALNSTAGTWVRADITASQVDWSVRRLLFDLGAPVDVSLSEVAAWQEEGGRGYPFSRRNAWILYTHLIQPVQSILDGKRHVFVVTSGSLTSLPLGVLVTEEPTGADGDPASLRATHWLADRYALIRMPTLQSLQLQRRLLAETAGATRVSGFSGFGDPLLDGQAATRGGGRGATRSAATRMGDVFAASAASAPGALPLANVAQLKRLARLPGTATELANMRSALGAPARSVRLGAAATESAIRSADLSQTRILALATHGLMAGEIDGAVEPGLVFTPPQEASPGDDGLLTASEIAGLRLNAEWVILSACNTAAGDGSEGAPGLSGLAQAFFFAGARTLLASHWPVRDDVAARLTVRTIEIQRDTPGLSRAEAFQRAMQEIRNDASHDTTIDTWAHPNAWAPFTLIGDGAQ